MAHLKKICWYAVLYNAAATYYTKIINVCCVFVCQSMLVVALAVHSAHLHHQFRKVELIHQELFKNFPRTEPDAVSSITMIQITSYSLLSFSRFLPFYTFESLYKTQCDQIWQIQSLWQYFKKELNNFCGFIFKNLNILWPKVQAITQLFIVVNGQFLNK